ncbi:MAG: hypothetical protein JOZ07_13285 [Solirubrobacterales bacterium]|nr:hypothetical protein [Solirubrobacterales bacterium]
MALTVAEAAGTYERALRGVVPAGPGVCRVCHTFIDEAYDTCYRCASDRQHLDAVVPITYSEQHGQIHTALRGYKDGPRAARFYVMPRLAAILWLFLEQHETCVAAACRVDAFDLVTTVPSSTREADERHGNLRWIVGEGSLVTADRFERTLTPAPGASAGRGVDAGRYRARRSLAGAAVLLVDDTWTSGGHAQSAAGALKAAGAAAVGCVVIGRHVNPAYAPDGRTCGQRLAALPRAFDWGVCCGAGCA